MPDALVLDFDASVKTLPGEERIPLREKQEAVRYSCRVSELRRLHAQLEPRLSASPAVVFMGSGDYHHLSYLLIERLRRLRTRIQVLVFDNHPDNMRYPFGIHCGSWVHHVSRLPFVANIHVAGITSSDVEGVHAVENHLSPLRSGKVTYWCVQRNLGALRKFGVRASRSFDSVALMLESLRSELESTGQPVYLSIDKDVLANDVVNTNWDQGLMRFEELESAIRMLQRPLIGSDVVGDVSSYRYRSGFKRLLSRLDRQPEIPAGLLEAWQIQHQKVNERLLALLRHR